jgi:hypothetical protein
MINALAFHPMGHEMTTCECPCLCHSCSISCWTPAVGRLMLLTARVSPASRSVLAQHPTWCLSITARQEAHSCASWQCAACQAANSWVLCFCCCSMLQPSPLNWCFRRGGRRQQVLGAAAARRPLEGLHPAGAGGVHSTAGQDPARRPGCAAAGPVRACFFGGWHAFQAAGRDQLAGAQGTRRLRCGAGVTRWVSQALAACWGEDQGLQRLRLLRCLKEVDSAPKPGRGMAAVCA